MKRKTAKEILAASFVELAKEKNVDKITVQEIVDNCGYSPACLGTVGLTCEWILGRYEAAPEKIAYIYESALPKPLEKYLL